MAKKKPTQQTLRLQPRDYELFADLGEVLFLDTDTIHRRYYPLDTTGNAVLRRLRQLSSAGLIEPIRFTVAYDSLSRKETIYRLTPHGGDVLAFNTGRSPTRLSRSDLPEAATLKHRVGLSRTILAVNDACVLQGLRPPQWLLESDTLDGATLNSPHSERFILYEHFPEIDGPFQSSRPDAACWLRLPYTRPDGESAFFDLLLYWEYDRSTETHNRILNKLPGHCALIASERYRQHWKDAPLSATPRLFFVVPSVERRSNLAKTLRPSAAAGYIYLATVADMTPERLLTEPVWMTPDGKFKTIYPKPPVNPPSPPS